MDVTTVNAVEIFLEEVALVSHRLFPNNMVVMLMTVVPAMEDVQMCRVISMGINDSIV
jgi:hypothetical protein